MSFNKFDELKATTIRSFASAVGTGLQTATNEVNCGGANFGALGVRTVKGNASQIWVRPQFSSDNGSTWYDVSSQARTGASVLATPVQYKIIVSGFTLIKLSGIYGNRLRVKTQGKSAVTGCFIGVDVWLDRK